MEIQKTGEQAATLVTSFTEKEKADSKFYTVMAAAALSKVPVHSCIVVDEKCNIYQAASYEHPTEG